MNTSRTAPLALVLAVVPGCKSSASSSPAAGFVARMENAHGADAWYSTPGIETRLTVELGGATALAGTMLFEPATGRARIELEGGGAMVFDGESAWATEGVPMARFHTLTWPYFLGVSCKLEDEGARVELEEPRRLGDVEYPTARLTFTSGTGDTPDDWYVLFADPENGRLAALAYIVTYGKDLAAAEARPSIGLYGGYSRVGELLLPGELVLHYWSEADGPEPEPKGRATFEGTRIVTPPAGAFERPEGAVVDALPAG